MKKHILTCCAFCFALCSFAQESVLHENIVRPSLTDDYIAAVLKIKEVCAANKINMSWRTFAFDDNTYTHQLPVEGTASLDTDLWRELKSKIGEDAFGKLVADLHVSVESQIQGVAVNMRDHSYSDPKPGENYRMILFLYPLPGKAAEMEALFLEWKKAFQAKKVPQNFHVYRIRHGGDEGYIVGVTAKDAADMERKTSETYKLLGAATQDLLWKKQMSLTRKYFWKRGYLVPELSYAYTAAN